MSDCNPGDFGGYGGRHVPEPMEGPLARLTGAFEDIAETDKDMATASEHFDLV